MYIYSFFSRKQGWPNGLKVKYYKSGQINDLENYTISFISKTGSEINDIIKKKPIKNKKIHEKLLDLSRIYYNFYYYSDDTEITSELTI